MDPLFLTISVLDQVWKISATTADLISTYREFDKDTIDLENKIRDENSRNKAIRRLLFDPSPTYGGRNLFEQFDRDVQERIQLFFEQSVELIDQAFQLLTRRLKRPDHGKDGAVSPVPTPEPITPTASTLSVFLTGQKSSESSSADSLFRVGAYSRVRWSLTDKKRVEAILRSFSEYNSRITEHIKLWSIASNVGINLQHLRRLEDDQDSRTLGFNIDAGLAIVAGSTQPTAETLEIKDPAAHQSLAKVTVTTDSGIGVLDWNGQPMLVEYRSYSPESPVPVDMDDRTKYLVDNLAALLHHDKEEFFRTPTCQGWIRQMSHNRVAFLFAVPDGFEPMPLSLLKALQSSSSAAPSSQIPVPSLEQRVILAYKLSRSISQLQLVKWVHESFRSENILFFPKADSESSAASVDLTQPWVLGFEFSRPELYFSQGHADFDPNRDIYRHPHRQQNPSQPFKKLHDIYALGVVLLEIGLWQAASTFERHGFAGVKDPRSIQDRLIKMAEKKLASKVGSKYQAVVLACLRGEFGVENDTKEDLKLQLAFRSQVVDVLEKIADNL